MTLNVNDSMITTVIVDSPAVCSKRVELEHVLVEEHVKLISNFIPSGARRLLRHNTPREKNLLALNIFQLKLFQKSKRVKQFITDQIEMIFNSKLLLV